MRNNLAPALIGSALLHVAVFGFALWKFPNETRAVLNAVPVQIVSEMPALAPAPAAEPTVEESPEPEPVVEETPPQPTPPLPEPPKPRPPKAEPKVDPKAAKKDKTPPKKAEEAAVDPLSFVKDLSKASSKKRDSKADAEGTSRSGPAKVDTGPAVNQLSAKLMRLWLPNCGVEGADQVVIKMRFALSSTGRLSQQPKWMNARTDAVWAAAALRAEAAIRKGEPYSDVPELFNQQIIVNFRGDEACR